jgi:8-amino-7-oxononanoate synthase
VSGIVTSALDRALEAELAAWRARGLERTLDDAPPADPRRDFVSNDYLGLARDERIVAAARAALEEAGAGARAARLLGGGSPWHARAEAAAAAWLMEAGAPAGRSNELAALLFPSGYQANLGVVALLAGRGDVVVTDEFVHASLIDAARLSRAHVKIFRHGDVDELDALLARSRGARRRVVVTESLFSMDGDLAPLDPIHELCERHDAALVVDEAHAAGLLGPEGAGGFALTGRRGRDAARLAARVVTGGKALGVAGAFVVGSRPLRELLLQRARSFVFTTAPPPAVAAALAAAIEAARHDATRRERALGGARRLAAALALPAPAAAIVPLPIDPASLAPNEAVVALRDGLARAGFAVGAVRPPTVPAGGARLRLVVHATNDFESVDELASALRDGLARTGARVAPRLATAAPAAARTLFVVGTDTGVGKTVASALLLMAARRCGRAAYWKPVQTGDEEDAATVRALSAAAEDEIVPGLHRFALPASPHAAAAAENATIDPGELARALAGQRARRAGATLVVELAGGLLVPYVAGPAPFLQADWLAREGSEAVVVARSGLGTLNHTLLTLEALRARHVPVAALLLVGPPHSSNRETLAQLAFVSRIVEIPQFSKVDGVTLREWLEHGELAPLFEAPARAPRSVRTAAR